MDDLISRKALLAEYDRVHVGPPGGARKLIENAPRVNAVDLPMWATERAYKNGYEQGKKNAVEVVHGHWTSTGIFSKKAGYGVRYYQHAECEVAPCRLFECEHDFCPCCGAIMDEPPKGE